MKRARMRIISIKCDAVQKRLSALSGNWPIDQKEPHRQPRSDRFIWNVQMSSLCSHSSVEDQTALSQKS